MSFTSATKHPSLRVLGELEKEVMEIIWISGAVTVRYVYESIKKSRKIAYTTVMTIMDRLFAKKILKRKKEGKTYRYSSSFNKNDFFEQTSRNIINNLVKDFGEVALAQFVNTLDQIDAHKLQALKERIKAKK